MLRRCSEREPAPLWAWQYRLPLDVPSSFSDAIKVIDGEVIAMTGLGPRFVQLEDWVIRYPSHELAVVPNSVFLKEYRLLEPSAVQAAEAITDVLDRLKAFFVGMAWDPSTGTAVYGQASFKELEDLWPKLHIALADYRAALLGGQVQAASERSALNRLVSRLEPLTVRQPADDSPEQRIRYQFWLALSEALS